MKIISLHDYKIMSCCKKASDLSQVTEYLKEYYYIPEINSYDLYRNLYLTYLDIADKNGLEKTFISDLKNLFLEKIFTDKNPKIDFSDLNILLYNALSFTQICEHKNDGLHNLYGVKIDDQIIPYTKVEDFLKTKQKIKEKKL